MEIKDKCIRCGFCCMEFPHCRVEGNEVKNGKCIHLIIEENKTN